MLGSYRIKHQKEGFSRDFELLVKLKQIAINKNIPIVTNGNIHRELSLQSAIKKIKESAHECDHIFCIEKINEGEIRLHIIKSRNNLQNNNTFFIIKNLFPKRNRNRAVTKMEPYNYENLWSETEN